VTRMTGIGVTGTTGVTGIGVTGVTDAAAPARG
jgi:hypothetical protein